jgi:hypothetical protein
MLPDPPPREPPENPPPPPRALAKVTVGTPMSAQTMQKAISFLVITSDCPFGCGGSRQLSSIILTGMGETNRRFEGRELEHKVIWKASEVSFHCLMYL